MTVEGNTRGPKTLMRQVTEQAAADSPLWCTQPRDGEATVKAVATPASPQQARRQRGASHGEGRKGNAQGGQQQEGQVHDDTDNKDDTAIDARKYKTKLCRNWQSGTPCPYGDRCVFAHGGRDVRRVDDPNPYLAKEASSSGGSNRRTSGGGARPTKGSGGSSNTSSQPRGPVASTTVVVGGASPVVLPPPPPPPLSSLPPVAEQLVAQPIVVPTAFPVADAPPNAPAAYPAQPGSVQATYTLQDGTQAAYAVRTVSLDTSPAVPAAVVRAPVSYATPLAHPVISDPSCLKAYAPQLIQQGVVIATPCATPCTGQVVQSHPLRLGAKANVKPLTMVSIDEPSMTHYNTGIRTPNSVKGTPATPDIPCGLVAPSFVPAPIISVPATPITPTTSTFRYDPYADPESPESANFVRKVDLSPTCFPWNEGGSRRDSDCGFSTPHQGSGSAMVLPLVPEVVYAA